ncbi:MAG: histidine kinase [Bacteroidales bacterium]|nr:histidine kinase [Bacteroidales bacterium]
MKNNWFYNSFVFRIAAPPLFGVVVYLLVLLFFDSVGMLAENFFSREVLFVIGLTYLFFESNRLIIVVLNKVYPLSKKIRLRILIQYVFSIFLTIPVISLALYFYFVYIIGFSTIQTELITFNTIFMFVAVFYHLYFFSFVFLNKRNELLIKHEKTKKENLELEMETFKNQINPTFLFQSLEIIVSELHNKKKQADDLIAKLAKNYRYTLDNQQNELVPVQQELNSIDPVLSLFKVKYGNALQLEIKKNINANKQLIPGTLQILFERAVFQNIITPSIPMHFSVSTTDTSLFVSYTLNRRISDQKSGDSRFEHLKKAYTYFTKSGIKVMEEKNKMVLIIPLITLDEE